MDEIELKRVLEAVQALLRDSPTNEVDGEDLAAALDISPEDPGARLYHALRELDRRGDIEATGWRGGMGLPYGIKRGL